MVSPRSTILVQLTRPEPLECCHNICARLDKLLVRSRNHERTLTIFFISSSGSNTVKKGIMLNRKGSTRVCRRWIIFVKKRERTWKHGSCGVR